MATKAQIKADLDRLGIEYPADALKPELEALLDDAGEPTETELERRRRLAPRCPGCGRSRLDGHIHQGK